MSTIIRNCCLIALLVCGSPLIMAADGETAPNPPGERGERGERQQRSPEEWAKMRQEREWRRLVETKPEFADLDPDSAEGQAALAAHREQRMQERGEQFRERIAERQTARHEELRVALGFDPDVFLAVEPLLSRVESLQMQRSLTSMGSSPMMRMMPGRGRGRGNDPGRFADMLLGDSELDPTVVACREAATALKSLIDDPQASEEEIALAVQRQRQATRAYQETLDLAQEDLRSVLTPRQEAHLLSVGILD